MKTTYKKIVEIQHALELAGQKGVPGWLELDQKSFKGVVNALPTREDITTPMKEQMIVELYSK